MNGFTKKGDEQVKEKEGNLICWGEWCGKGRISAWVFINRCFVAWKEGLMQLACNLLLRISSPLFYSESENKEQDCDAFSCLHILFSFIGTFIF